MPGIEASPPPQGPGRVGRLVAVVGFAAFAAVVIGSLGLLAARPASAVESPEESAAEAARHVLALATAERTDAVAVQQADAGLPGPPPAAPSQLWSGTTTFDGPDARALREPSRVARAVLDEPVRDIVAVGDLIVAVTLGEMVTMNDRGRILARRRGEFGTILADGGLFVQGMTTTLELDARTLRTLRTYDAVGPMVALPDEIWFQDFPYWNAVDRTTGAVRRVFDDGLLTGVSHSPGLGERVVSTQGMSLVLVSLGGAEPDVIASAPGRPIHVGSDGTIFSVPPGEDAVIERRSGETLALIDRTVVPGLAATTTPNAIGWASEAQMLLVPIEEPERSLALWRPGADGPVATIGIVGRPPLVVPDGSLAVAIDGYAVEFHTFAPRIGATSTPILEPRWAPTVALAGTGLDAVEQVLVDGASVPWHRDRTGRIVIDVGERPRGGSARIEVSSPLGGDRVDLDTAVPRGRAVVSIRATPAAGAAARSLSFRVSCDGATSASGNVIDDVAEVVLVASHDDCSVDFGSGGPGVMRSGYLDADGAGALVDIGTRSLPFRSGAPVHVGAIYGDRANTRRVWVVVDGAGGPPPSARATLTVRCGAWRTRLRVRPGGAHRVTVPASARPGCRAAVGRAGRASIARADRFDLRTGQVTASRTRVLRFRLGQVSGRGYLSFLLDHGRSDASVPLVIGAPGDDIGRRADAGLVHVFPTGLGGEPDAGASGALRAGRGLPGRPAAGSRLGEAVALGDFDGDGFADLAVGAPGARVGRHAEGGRVVVSFGGPRGVGGARAAVIHEGQAAVPGRAGRAHEFGASLAVADFDGDGRDDLVIGVPGARVGRVAGAGRVLVVEGGLDGVGDLDVQVLTQRDVDGDRPQRGDAFGASVDGFDRYVAVGVPGERRGRASRAGTVHVFDGFALAPIRLRGLPAPAPGDALGAAVAISDVEVFAGAPGRDVRGVVDAGGVFVARLSDGRGGFFGPDRFGAPIATGFAEGSALASVLLDRGWAALVGGPGDATPGVARAGSVSLRGANASQGWIDRSAPALPGSPRAGERFGSSLTSGRRGQIVVGAAGGGPQGSGSVLVGSSAPRWFELHQDVRGVADRAERGDRFGAAVAG